MFTIYEGGTGREFATAKTFEIAEIVAEALQAKGYPADTINDGVSGIWTV